MQTWAKVGLVFITIVVVAAVAQGKPEVSIKCGVKSGVGECVIDNKGSKYGDVQADVILVCRDGEHSAHVAARVEPGSHVTKIIERFEPRLGFLSSCAGIDYRNFTVR